MRPEESTVCVDHGIVCCADDERRLLRNIDAFLASRQLRPMGRREDTSIQPPERSFRIAHYWSQFARTHPRWYLELRPNADLDGKHRFPEHRDCAWTLFTNKSSHEANSAADDALLESFFADLRAALGFPTRELHVYAPGEERL